MNLLFIILLTLFTRGDSKEQIKPINGVIQKSIDLDSIGACQGVSYINNEIYCYGDRKMGVLRYYKLSADSIYKSEEEECRFIIEGKVIIKHPTGIAYNQGIAFIGNSVRSEDNPEKWKAMIYCIDWEKLLESKTLDNSLINTIEDDLAIQGTRPEQIQFNNQECIATADYGSKKNEVRLYEPNILKRAKKTSEPGVLIAKFSCGPWVQNLNWIPEKKILVLTQNITEGKGWRLSFLDLEKSIKDGKEKIIQVIDFDREDELEGFCLLNNLEKGLAVSSSKKNNMNIIRIKWNKQ